MAASSFAWSLALLRLAGGALPPYTRELGDSLWQEAEEAVKGMDYVHNEAFVCGAGNWGDGPQCDQWDQGRSPCWPSAMTVSASWDVDLVARWSIELAEEFGRASRGQLGPGVNLARFAWNGRLGEYMAGEDPHFGAEMVRAMVAAYRQVEHPPLQTVKHFIPNTIENDRQGMTETVDERTLFEVYYPPFAAAVEAGVSGVMCSYNLVKCTSGLCSGDAAYACANDDILNKHLKEIMGFRGIVISDWDATKCQDESAGSGGCAEAGGYVDNDYAASAGLDLEMPSCMSFKGGVSKRAKEKATRMQWAYLVQGRRPSSEGGRRLLRNSSAQPRAAEAEEEGYCCWWPQPPGDVCARCTNRRPLSEACPEDRQCAGGGDGAGVLHPLPVEVPPPEGAARPLPGRPPAAEDPEDAALPWLHAGILVPLPEALSPSPAPPAPSAAPPAPSPAPPASAPAPPAPANGSVGPPAPSWSTGVYDENPFGSSAPAPPPPAAGSQQGPGCPDEGGDNYKSECKLGLADRIIAESATVLKNGAGVLPLAKGAAIALVGSEACAEDPLAQGGGSGWNGFACNEVPKVNVRDGIAFLDGVAEPSCPGAGDGDNPFAGEADVIVAVVAPAKASEGADRETLQLNSDDVRLIQKYGGLGKKLVVVINAPGPMITSTWDAVADAILITWLPGQQNGKGIAMALYGEAYEASGRLPFTFPKCSTESCAPEDELASVALGDKISSKEYRTFTEKALIGYRWYHAQGVEVSYPFGFGLFAYGSAEVAYSRAEAVVGPDVVTISAQLLHSGPREGRDVPQLYLSFPESVPGDAESKPEWVLKGFSKLTLKPGKAEAVSFVLSGRDLSYWDDSPGVSRWVCAEGEFRACVGANARDAVLPGRGACTRFSPPCGGALELAAEDAQATAQLAGPGPAPWGSPAAWAAAALSALAASALARLGRWRGRAAGGAAAAAPGGQAARGPEPALLRPLAEQSPMSTLSCRRARSP